MFTSFNRSWNKWSLTTFWVNSKQALFTSQYNDELFRCFIVFCVSSHHMYINMSSNTSLSILFRRDANKTSPISNNIIFVVQLSSKQIENSPKQVIPSNNQTLTEPWRNIYEWIYLWSYIQPFLYTEHRLWDYSKKMIMSMLYSFDIYMRKRAIILCFHYSSFKYQVVDRKRMENAVTLTFQ